ncbi:hypothetical protein CA265_11490 [Sphingobacteriaceae bacterium GW460-11-11-14-LB5]|nr:hypothetical protein CA265_11490 [Sphingobacteriaceae bacterium GW460-11-11-14-LB5]
MLNSKTLIPSFVFLILFNFASAQSVNCRKMREGVFKMVTRGIPTTIKRYKNYQLEYFNNATKPITFKIQWIDDCTYTLKPDASAFLKYPQIPRNALITVRITKTYENGYTMKTTANFNNKTMVGEVIKVK